MIQENVRQLFEKAYRLGFEDGSKGFAFAPPTSEQLGSLVPDLEPPETENESEQDSVDQAIHARYHELVDKKFSVGLTDQEQQELESLRTSLEASIGVHEEFQNCHFATQRELLAKYQDRRMKITFHLDQILAVLDERIDDKG